MNSRRSNPFIDGIDNVIRQALQPIGEAEAPGGVWQRIVMELDNPQPRRRGLLCWLRALETFSMAPLTRRYCIGPYGRCLAYPFPEIIAVQFRGQHIAS